MCLPIKSFKVSYDDIHNQNEETEKLLAPFLKVAEEDIPCIKTGYRNKESKGFTSIVFNFLYEEGKTYSLENFTYSYEPYTDEGLFSRNDTIISIEKAFHSYSLELTPFFSTSSLKYIGYGVMYCTIPKGTKYYEVEKFKSDGTKYLERASYSIRIDKFEVL